MAGDCRAEQEALQQLRQLGSLPSTDVAGALVRDILGRAQAHGADTISQELLQRVAERCAEAGGCLSVARQHACNMLQESTCQALCHTVK